MIDNIKSFLPTTKVEYFQTLALRVSGYFPGPRADGAVAPVDVFLDNNPCVGSGATSLKPLAPFTFRNLFQLKCLPLLLPDLR